METFHVKILYPTIIIELSTYILCNMILEDVPLNVIKTNPLPLIIIELSKLYILYNIIFEDVLLKLCLESAYFTKTENFCQKYCR